MVLNYMFDATLCAVINVDFSTKDVHVENLAEDIFYRPFGVLENPSFEDFKSFLEERCFPRTVHHVKYYLKRLGLEVYDPLDIVRKTNGRVYGDKFWIEIVNDNEMEVLHE